MNLTLTQLRYFVAVADELHFTRAAERLRVTTPALSQQIATLERRMVVKLFERTSRGVRLTSQGAGLLPLARTALGAVDDVIHWATEHGSRERIRLGIPVGWMLMSKILNAVADQLPNVDLEVHRIAFHRAIQAVSADDVDVALTPLFGRQDPGGLQITPLWSEVRMLVVGVNHRLADRSSVALAETSAERYVQLGDDETYSDWLVIPRPDGTTPRTDLKADGFEDVLDLCSAGLAVHIVGASAAASFNRSDVRFIPITDTPDVTCCLLRRSSTSIALDAFNDLVLSVVRENADTYQLRLAANDAEGR